MCRLHTLPSGWMVEGEYIDCLLRFCPVQSLLFYFNFFHTLPLLHFATFSIVFTISTNVDLFSIFYFNFIIKNA